MGAVSSLASRNQSANSASIFLWISLSRRIVSSTKRYGWNIRRSRFWSIDAIPSTKWRAFFATENETMFFDDYSDDIRTSPINGKKWNIRVSASFFISQQHPCSHHHTRSQIKYSLERNDYNTIYSSKCLQTRVSLDPVGSTQAHQFRDILSHMLQWPTLFNKPCRLCDRSKKRKTATKTSIMLRKNVDSHAHTILGFSTWLLLCTEWTCGTISLTRPWVIDDIASSIIGLTSDLTNVVFVFCWTPLNCTSYHSPCCPLQINKVNKDLFIHADMGLLEKAWKFKHRDEIFWLAFLSVTSTAMT